MSLSRFALRIVFTFWLAVTLLILVAAGNDSQGEDPQIEDLPSLALPKPPITLLIQKHLWMVLERDTLKYPSEAGEIYLGITDSPHRVIWLQEGQGMGEECETLHHEIKHAILGTNSDHIETEHEFIYDSSPDEVKVYFRDNPKLLSYSQQACRDFSDKGDQ